MLNNNWVIVDKTGRVAIGTKSEESLDDVDIVDNEGVIGGSYR